MPAHDKDYRENFGRSLFLTGKITQEAAYPKSANKRAPSRQRRSDNPLHRQPWGIFRGSGGHPFFNQGSGSGRTKMPINYGRDRNGSERGSGFVSAG